MKLKGHFDIEFLIARRDTNSDVAIMKMGQQMGQCASFGLTRSYYHDVLTHPT